MAVGWTVGSISFLNVFVLGNIQTVSPKFELESLIPFPYDGKHHTTSVSGAEPHESVTRTIVLYPRICACVFRCLLDRTLLYRLPKSTARLCQPVVYIFVELCIWREGAHQVDEQADCVQLCHATGDVKRVWLEQSTGKPPFLIAPSKPKS